MTKRHVEVSPETQAAVDETVAYVDERLSEGDTAAAVAEILADLFGDSEAYERYQFERAWAWAVVFMVVVLAIEYFILRPLERRAYEYRQDAELDTLL
jgi:cytochrome c-type biogenesis protein CcmH/NrfF